MYLQSKKQGNQNKLAAVVCLLLAGPVSMPAGAAEWDYGLDVDLGVIRSDNIRLAPGGQELSDTVLLVIPALHLATDSDRIKVDVRYKPEAYFFDKSSDANEIFHVLDAQLTTALVRDALYLFGSAVNTQTSVSPERPFTQSNLPVLDHRTDFSVVELRPYWQQDLRFADVLAEYAYIDSEYDDDGGQFQYVSRTNTQQRGRFSLNNHSHQSGLAWGLDYLRVRVEYEDIEPWVYQQASANLGYWFGEVVRVFGRGGKESPYDDIFNSDLEESFWEAGFHYRPNQRLDLEMAIGERSFGDSLRGSLSYSFRRGQTTFNYNEAPSSRGLLGSDVRPLVSSDNLDGFLDRPGDTDRFVQRRGEWTTEIALAKTDISLRLFGELRDERLSAEGEPLPDEEYYGGALRFAWRVGVKSTVGAQIDTARRELQSAGALSEKSDFSRFMVDYTYAMSQRYSLIAAISRSSESSDGLSALNYDENQIRLTLRASF